jgi:hypothetical protein
MFLEKHTCNTAIKSWYLFSVKTEAILDALLNEGIDKTYVEILKYIYSRATL